jgi:hypothetical protein
VFDEPIVEVAVSSEPASRVQVVATPIVLPWLLDTQLLEEETPSAAEDSFWRDDNEAPAELAMPWFEDTWHDESEAPDDNAGEREDDAWRPPPEPEPVLAPGGHAGSSAPAPPPPAYVPPPPPPPRPTRRVTHRWLYRGMFDGHGAEEFPGEFAERAGPGKYEDLDWDERPVSAIDAWATADALREANAFTWGRVSAVDHHDGEYLPPGPAVPTLRNGSTHAPAGHHATAVDDTDDNQYAAPRLNLREALEASREAPASDAWPRPPHFLGAVHDV